MAENAPPPSTSAADSTRGVPYYEKLKRDVRDTLNRKRLMDKNMVTPPSWRGSFRHRAPYKLLTLMAIGGTGRPNISR